MKNSKIRKATLIGTALIIAIVLSMQSIAIIEDEKTDPKNVEMPPNWYDTFDVYEDGQFLDGTPDDGGWEPWDSDPTFGAYVTSEMSITPPHSVAIAGPTDLVHLFEGYNSGVWNFSAWVFVDSATFEGSSYFLILNEYYHGGGQEGNHWSAQVAMDSFSETVIAEHDGWELPLIMDEWVQFLAIIDLDTDYYEMYYNDEILEYKEWTAGPNNDYAGILEIQCLDLYANGASAVYYDDIAFRAFGSPPEPDLSAAGSITFINVTAGSSNTGGFFLANAGSAGSTLNWEIESVPDWGTWTITPDGGATELGSPVEVEVTVVAPDEQESAFTGEIKIVNSDKAEDFAIIPCSLTTPKVKQSFIQQFIGRFPILRNIFGL